jgi:hypothetical protein
MKRVVARESQIVGTFDDETLAALLNGGTLKLSDQYWDETRSTWGPMTDYLGYKGPKRRIGAAALRFVTLVIAAGCGSLATWMAMKDPAPVQVGPLASAGQERPPQAGTPTLTPAPTPALAPPPAVKPAEKAAPPPALALLNVEVFDDNVAVTVQNKGPEAVKGFDLKLKYFQLPGDQLVFERNENAISQQETGQTERIEAIKALDARIGALGRNLKLVSTDVMIWTTSHIKALPTAEQWQAFGDGQLTAAGAALSNTAAAFATGAASTDAAAREKALTGHLLDLARGTEDMKPLLKAAIERATTERNRIATEQRAADEDLARLKKQQNDLRPRLAEQMAEARKRTIRVENVHVDAVIESELVRRITVKHEKNERESVVVELAQPDPKTVARSDSL